jgi:hypothetical protein
MDKSNNINQSTPEFFKLISNIKRVIPLGTLWFILFTYLITAIINSVFLPLPKVLSILASVTLAFGRFLVVFTEFLLVIIPRRRLNWQKIVAGSLTLLALVELWFSVVNTYPTNYIAVFLNLGSIIILGFALEISFIEKASIGTKQKQEEGNFLESPKELKS